MVELLRWAVEDAEYLTSRPMRYPGGIAVLPEWTIEALADWNLVKLEPDPKSRSGAIRFIGFSASAGRVVTVIAKRDSDGVLHGINAWPATGADVRIYRGGVEYGGKS